MKEMEDILNRIRQADFLRNSETSCNAQKEKNNLKHLAWLKGGPLSRMKRKN